MGLRSDRGNDTNDNAMRYRAKVSGANSVSGGHSLVGEAISLSQDRPLVSGTNSVSDDHTLVDGASFLSQDRTLATKSVRWDEWVVLAAHRAIELWVTWIAR
jgi:hypothetical protein